MTTTTRGTRPASSTARLDSIPLSALSADLVAIGAALIAGVLGRGTIRLPGQVGRVDLTETLGLVGPVIVAGWIAVIALSGGYRREIFGAGVDEYKRVANSSVVTAAAVGIACYLLRFPLSRGFFVLVFLLGTPLLILGRFLVRRSVHRAHRRGSLLHRVVIAGSAAHVDEVAGVLAREKWLGYHVIGAVTPDVGVVEATPGGVPVIGDSGGLAGTAREVGADIIFLAGGAFDSPEDLRDVSWDLEDERVQIVVAPNVTDVSRERVRIRPVGGLPLIHLEKPRASKASRWGKRAFDIVGSTCLLIVFSPLLIASALAVVWHDRGPVLFRQSRIGRDGQRFQCWKLRTMVPDAEGLLESLHERHGYDGGLFKIRDDPRVTRPGRFLRRYSIDELPQLVNVLLGDMSLVGPRPPLEAEVAQYDRSMRRRLRVRPGMSGLWQVSGRSDLAWSEAIRLDLYYVENWSMLQDLVILARTFAAVVGRRGAY